MQIIPSNPGRPMLVKPTRWLLANITGWTGGLVLAIALVVAVESLGVPSLQFPLALGMGIGVGFAQARVLAPWLERRAWLIATAAGLTAPFLVADAAAAVARPVPFLLFAYVAIGGTIVGVLQWRLLRRVWANASLWLVASPIGWLLAASSAAVDYRRFPGALTGALLYLGLILLGGVLLGAATAPALQVISRTAVPPAPGA